MNRPEPPTGRPLILGVLSDTHGHVRYTEQAIAAFREHAVQTVIHCGDIGTTAVIDLLEPWTTHYVFGNVDESRAELLHARARAVGAHWHGLAGQIELGGRRIGFTHGHDAPTLQHLIFEAGLELVCHGHTHEYRWERAGSTRILNPGAVYRGSPRSVAVVRLPELEHERIVLPPAY